MGLITVHRLVNTNYIAIVTHCSLLKHLGNGWNQFSTRLNYIKQIRRLGLVTDISVTELQKFTGMTLHWLYL